MNVSSGTLRAISASPVNGDVYFGNNTVVWKWAGGTAAVATLQSRGWVSMTSLSVSPSGILYVLDTIGISGFVYHYVYRYESGDGGARTLLQSQAGEFYSIQFRLRDLYYLGAGYIGYYVNETSSMQFFKSDSTIFNGANSLAFTTDGSLLSGGANGVYFFRGTSATDFYQVRNGAGYGATSPNALTALC